MEVAIPIPQLSSIKWKESKVKEEVFKNSENVRALFEIFKIEELTYLISFLVLPNIIRLETFSALII